MRKTIAAVTTASLALLSAPDVRAQGNPTSGSAAGHPDEIVNMHQQVAAANREYDREVAAARKVFDHKKAEAKKRRDVAVEAAQSGVSQ